MPPAEAMAVGTPVIASHATSLGEVISDAGLLVDPYDHTALAEAMDAVVNDFTLTARLREKGFTRAAQFTWEKSARTLERVFENFT